MRAYEVLLLSTRRMMSPTFFSRVSRGISVGAASRRARVIAFSTWSRHREIPTGLSTSDRHYYANIYSQVALVVDRAINGAPRNASAPTGSPLLPGRHPCASFLAGDSQQPQDTTGSLGSTPMPGVGVAHATHAACVCARACARRAQRSSGRLMRLFSHVFRSPRKLSWIFCKPQSVKWCNICEDDAGTHRMLAFEVKAALLRSGRLHLPLFVARRDAVGAHILPACIPHAAKQARAKHTTPGAPSRDAVPPRGPPRWEQP
jgi:hypothetical protein